MAGEVARLRGLTYPGHHPGPGSWLDVVSGLIDTGMGYLRVASAVATTDADASRLIRDSEQLGNWAYQMLQELDGADADQIPHQIVGPFQRWVDGLGIDNDIFFRADHVANYELRRFFYDTSLGSINSPAKSLTDATAAIQWPFMRLTVPSQALGMLPHFAIVGHELGHAIQDRIRPDFSKFDTSGFDTALAARLASEKLAVTRATVLLAQDILASWIQEFKSDAVGFLLAGPAFFFALGGFFEITGGGYGIGASHPPSDMRRRLLLDRLRAGAVNHADVFEGNTGLKLEEDLNSPHLKSLPDDDVLFAELKTGRPLEEAAICVALLPLAEQMAQAIFDECENVLRRDSAAMIYSPEHLHADLSYHLEPLCALIPPVERRDGGTAVATSLAGILNVGWAALLSRLDRIPVPATLEPDKHETYRMERLHELLLKAVELAEARTVWDEQP